MSAGRKHASHCAGRKGHAASIAAAISSRVLRALTAAAESESDTKIERDDDARATAVDIDAGLPLETLDEKPDGDVDPASGTDVDVHVDVFAGPMASDEEALAWVSARTTDGSIDPAQWEFRSWRLCSDGATAYVQLHYKGTGDAAAAAAAVEAMHERNAKGEFVGLATTEAPDGLDGLDGLDGPASTASTAETKTERDDDACATAVDIDAGLSLETHDEETAAGLLGWWWFDRTKVQDGERGYIDRADWAVARTPSGRVQVRFVGPGDAAARAAKAAAMRARNATGEFATAVTVNSATTHIDAHVDAGAGAGAGARTACDDADAGDDAWHGEPRAGLIATVVPIAGGHTSARGVEPEERAMLEALRAGVEYKLNGGVPYASFAAVSVRTQVVSGVNYIFRVDVDGSAGGASLEVTVWKPLVGPNQLTGAVVV